MELVKRFKALVKARTGHGFPADPWEHLSRINSCQHFNKVGEYYAATKWAYFFAYSLFGHVQIDAQLAGLDIYSAMGSLLLCWQYYRLARAVGLSERSSLLFVLLNALVFGDNLFGFYRYYGMSSTVFGKVGVTVEMPRIRTASAKPALRA